MSEIIDQTVSLPTVIFTVPLIFCFLWFLLGFVVSGFDIGDADFDVDLDGDGNIDGLEHLFAALHLGALGLPLALFMLSFAAWAVSLFFCVAVADTNLGTGLTVAIGILLGLLAG